MADARSSSEVEAFLPEVRRCSEAVDEQARLLQLRRLLPHPCWFGL